MGRISAATVAIVVAACTGRGRQLAPIRLEQIASLGEDKGDGAIATDPTVTARHPGGFRVVVPGPGGIATTPLIFGDNGRYVGSLAGGRLAEEQFQSPLFARIGPADSIWVFDGAPRVLVFGPDRAYVRTAPLPEVPWDALVLPDGRMLIAPANADRALPLLMLDPDGRTIGRFGSSDTTAPMRQSPRWLVRDPDGSFWSMPTQYRWQLEHWDTSGVLISAVDRRPEWFGPYSRISTPDRNHAPQPAIRGIWIDRTGRLWVLGTAADPKWESGLGSTQSGARATVIADPDKVYDAVLEVLEPRRTGAVTTVRLDPAYSSVVEPGVLLHIRETPGGWKRAELMKVVVDTGRAAPKPSGG